VQPIQIPLTITFAYFFAPISIELILSNLNNHNLSSSLIDFSVNVVLVNQLRKVIDESYARSWKSVESILNG
jgi:hypothetical protein